MYCLRLFVVVLQEMLQYYCVVVIETYVCTKFLTFLSVSYIHAHLS